jgi:hypothetical protein
MNVREYHDYLLNLRDWTFDAWNGKKRWHLLEEQYKGDYVAAIDSLDILENNFELGFWQEAQNEQTKSN